MLVHLGERRSASDVVDLLLECHERIPRFTALAARLAAAGSPTMAETKETARQIHRYFVESFPLHLADEDEDLAPRLAGSNSELDRALARMTTDHTAHEHAVARLVAICAVLEQEPSRRRPLARDLAGAASDLRARLEPHLELEERIVFPAVRCLHVSDQEAIRDAMRVRRERVLGGKKSL